MSQENEAKSEVIPTNEVKPSEPKPIEPNQTKNANDGKLRYIVYYCLGDLLIRPAGLFTGTILREYKRTVPYILRRSNGQIRWFHFDPCHTQMMYDLQAILEADVASTSSSCVIIKTDEDGAVGSARVYVFGEVANCFAFSGAGDKLELSGCLYFAEWTPSGLVEKPELHRNSIICLRSGIANVFVCDFREVVIIFNSGAQYEVQLVLDANTHDNGQGQLPPPSQQLAIGADQARAIRPLRIRRSSQHARLPAPEARLGPESQAKESGGQMPILPTGTSTTRDQAATRQSQQERRKTTTESRSVNVNGSAKHLAIIDDEQLKKMNEAANEESPNEDGEEEESNSQKKLLKSVKSSLGFTVEPSDGTRSDEPTKEKATPKAAIQSQPHAPESKTHSKSSSKPKITSSKSAHISGATKSEGHKSRTPQKQVIVSPGKKDQKEKAALKADGEPKKKKPKSTVHKSSGHEKSPKPPHKSKDSHKSKREGEKSSSSKSSSKKSDPNKESKKGKKSSHSPQDKSKDKKKPSTVYVTALEADEKHFSENKPKSAKTTDKAKTADRAKTPKSKKSSGTDGKSKKSDKSKTDISKSTATPSKKSEKSKKSDDKKKSAKPSSGKSSNNSGAWTKLSSSSTTEKKSSKGSEGKKKSGGSSTKEPDSKGKSSDKPKKEKLKSKSTDHKFDIKSLKTDKSDSTKSGKEKKKKRDKDSTSPKPTKTKSRESDKKKKKRTRDADDKPKSKSTKDPKSTSPHRSGKKKSPPEVIKPPKIKVSKSKRSLNADEVTAFSGGRSKSDKGDKKKVSSASSKHKHKSSSKSSNKHSKSSTPKSKPKPSPPFHSDSPRTEAKKREAAVKALKSGRRKSKAARLAEKERAEEKTSSSKKAKKSSKSPKKSRDKEVAITPGVPVTEFDRMKPGGNGMDELSIAIRKVRSANKAKIAAVKNKRLNKSKQGHKSKDISASSGKKKKPKSAPSGGSEGKSGRIRVRLELAGLLHDIHATKKKMRNIGLELAKSGYADEDAAGSHESEDKISEEVDALRKRMLKVCDILHTLIEDIAHSLRDELTEQLEKLHEASNRMSPAQFELYTAQVEMLASKIDEMIDTTSNKSSNEAAK